MGPSAPGRQPRDVGPVTQSDKRGRGDGGAARGGAQS